MSHIKIEREHNFGADAARERISQLEPKLREKYGVALDWSGHRAEVKGTGVSGVVHIEETRVALELKLGLMLRPLSKKIQDAMEHQVDRVLTDG